MSHAEDDHFDFEPVPGLPEELPDGERILWQGAPNWKVLTLSAFYVGGVLVYFVLLMAWRLYARTQAGDTITEAMVAALSLWPLLVSAVLILSIIGWYSAKTTLYTITNRRVVMRIGIALSTTINVPFKAVASAALRSRMLGTGDIPLTLKGPERLGYVHLWPHVRPWRYRIPEPMLRAVPDAASVAGILSRALVDAEGGAATDPQPESSGSTVEDGKASAGAMA